MPLFVRISPTLTNYLKKVLKISSKIVIQNFRMYRATWNGKWPDNRRLVIGQWMAC